MTWLHTKPVIHPKVWNDVPDEQVMPSMILRDFIEYRRRQAKSEVAQRNVFRVFGIVQRARWVEVINTPPKSVMPSFPTALGLFLVVVMPGVVLQKIEWPSDQLTTN